MQYEMRATTPTLEALNSAARLAHVDTFFHWSQNPTDWESAAANIRHRAEARTTLLEEMLHRWERPGFRDWGINE